VYTRAFAQGEGMLIPLADHLNHEDVCVDYITLSLEFLQTKSITGALLNDYKDFTGVSQNSNSLMKTRTHKNRLEKYLTWFDDEKICDMSAIWEIDQILTDLESSSDEEDPICKWTSEESSESVGDEFDLHFDPTDKYFVMRTKDKGSFKAGQQIFNCYGRLSNFDMLLDYGFCIQPNRYDSVHLRLYKGKLIHISHITNKKKFKTFNLKNEQLNIQLLNYIRKRYRNKDNYKTLANTANEEIKLVNYVKNMVEEAYQIYPTLLEYDKELLNQKNNYKFGFAISKCIFRL
jgi:hypothetical protein